MSMETGQGNTTGQGPGSTAMRDLLAGIGLSVAMFLALLFIPITGVAAGMIVPMPSLISVYRFGNPLGYVVPGGSAVVGGTLSLLLKTPQSVTYFFELLLLGTLLGAGMRKGWSVTRVVAEAAVKVFAFGSLVFWLVHRHADGGLWGHLESRLRDFIVSFLEQAHPETVSGAALPEAVDAWIALLARLFPGVAMGTTIVCAWLSLYLSRKVLVRRGVPLPPWAPWVLWSAPEHLVWAVIAAGFLMLVSSVGAKIIGANVVIALGAVYLLQGLAITAYYFGRWRLPSLVQAFGYTLIFLQQFVSLAVALMGFFDTWFDFRRLKKKADVPSAS
uniref:DUF2232 domain-containing protein n=1 Tax=Desulfacinum infernum TaxID=35837 RepID=A0A832EAE1_9BACT